MHTFGACPVTLRVKERMRLRPPQRRRCPAEELRHSLLGFDYVPDSDEALRTIFTCWAIWCESRKGCYDTQDEAVKVIQKRDSGALHEFHAAKPARKTKTSSKKNRSDVFLEVDEILASIHRDAIVAFTDGSSNPNPGPSGAGAWLSFLHPDRSGTTCTVESSAALGKGTNNRGELWGLGLALQLAKDLIVRNYALRSEVHIFSDSRYASDAVEEKTKNTENLALIIAVRKLYRSMLDAGFTIEFHWVKGHSGVAGNETADRLAGEASARSSNSGFTPAVLKERIRTGNFTCPEHPLQQLQLR